MAEFEVEERSVVLGEMEEGDVGKMAEFEEVSEDRKGRRAGRKVVGSGSATACEGESGEFG